MIIDYLEVITFYGILFASFHFMLKNLMVLRNKDEIIGTWLDKIHKEMEQTEVHGRLERKHKRNLDKDI